MGVQTKKCWNLGSSDAVRETGIWRDRGTETGMFAGGNVTEADMKWWSLSREAGALVTEQWLLADAVSEEAWRDERREGRGEGRQEGGTARHRMLQGVRHRQRPLQTHRSVTLARSDPSAATQ